MASLSDKIITSKFVNELLSWIAILFGGGLILLLLLIILTVVFAAFRPSTIPTFTLYTREWQCTQSFQRYEDVPHRSGKTTYYEKELVNRCKTYTYSPETGHEKVNP